MNPKLIKIASVHLEEMVRRDGINPQNSIFNVIVKVAQNPISRIEDLFGSMVVGSGITTEAIDQANKVLAGQAAKQVAGEVGEQAAKQVAGEVGEQAAKQVAQQAPTVAKKGWGPVLRRVAGGLGTLGVGALGGVGATYLRSSSTGPFSGTNVASEAEELLREAKAGPQAASQQATPQQAASQQTGTSSAPEAEITTNSILNELYRRLDEYNLGYPRQ